MSRALTAPRAAGLVRAWVHLYTAGMEPAVRDARRDEVASDLWEQVSEEVGSQALGAAIWFRWVFGIPDDLSWRLAHARAKRKQTRESAMIQAREYRTMTIVAVIVAAAFLLALVAMQAISEIEYQRQTDFALMPDWTILLGIAGPVALGSIVFGFVWMRRAPMLGAVLASAGGFGVGILFYWLVLPLVFASGLSWFAFRRARHIQAGQ